MSTFTILSTISTTTKNNKTVSIVKFSKQGTKSTFFAPMVGDKFITRTRFVRLWEAQELGKRYLNA